MKKKTLSDGARNKHSRVENENVKTTHATPTGVSVDAQIYPLDLLSAVAARLLEGNDYVGAVERAVALLNACRKYQQEALRNKSLLNEIEALGEARQNEEQTARRVPFSSALEKIYGRSRMDRNLESHLVMTSDRLGLVGELLDKAISEEMKQGFLPSEVDALANRYKAIPSADWRAIVAEYKQHRKPPENKSLDRLKKRDSGKKPRAPGN